MTEDATSTVSRVQRRKQQTRAALINAAQALIAEGRTNVPVIDITQAADVGIGSFYNHFDSKEQLFAAAVEDVLDKHGAVLDHLTAAIEDPAETFACSFRLTGRLFRRRPQESQILLSNAAGILTSDRGLAPRALRDIKAAVAAGRFHVHDPDLAVAVAGGALLGLGTLLRNEPERDDAESSDIVTADVLCLFGMSRREATRICTRPLPQLDDV
ncbi:TetR/AcrR family transcriptional regulator [Mycobacterium sp. CBMA293]|uniref:TetR/AcrR family transcriptional regulator n=1 Tax=unclassified Mycolicibacterium TaxID=2636767 RepID=UPI0012DD6CC7|nr:MULTISPECIES: TetR/AcrR family transcriptional regulator [unclassified Mycolicibacterium]MUL49672.1 TetR/AcrR family transcriptional regulator [Mycolicibacterium sp. CBMA 360]MUL60107.1 TetR/AcrR family transcriptional regulator [Mycolicibacterium sp. CBMA 335]MUL72894.1 TetR/AcrR family transcriptional regulator [Mycolicibacterium sp. CBMA 311]MUL96131.1 TetR/AcrR family transcriptional regulator [Mycolicibacterium sp. CBMA 230]MUM08146.1 TetR family transcriptional regulator [Mycolicibact